MSKRTSRLILAAVIVLSAVACDQITKHYARTFLQNSGTIRVIGDFFVLRYTENQGAFLGLGAHWPRSIRYIIFSVLSLLIVCVIAVQVIRQKQMNLVQTIVSALIIGGGIGNLIDRLIHDGSVTDFMNIGIGRVRTGIFNAADIFLIVGLGLFILMQQRKKANQV